MLDKTPEGGKKGYKNTQGIAPGGYLIGLTGRY